MPRTAPAILCFGEALIDFLALPSEAEAGANGRRFLEQAGGAPANVAVGIVRLGGNARFAGMLSSDMFGDFLLAQFTRFGVDTRFIRRTDQARTALAFVSLDAHGERSFNFYRPPAADLLFRPGDFDPDAFAGLGAFHVCSNSLTEAASADTTLHGMRQAAAADVLVSMDLNLRPALWPDGADPGPMLWRALELAQLVKLSAEELEVLSRDGGEQAVIARLFSHAARAVLVTDGPAPIRWFTRASSGTAPAFTVDAVDTTAAGDAFVAGLLLRLVERGVDGSRLAAAFEDASLRVDLLQHAAAAGALATTRHGAFAAMPDRAQLRALLETAP